MLKLPKTRYQGSKNKLIDKIYEHIQTTIPQTKCILDLFGGTSIVSLFFKSKGYNVCYNDVMKFNSSVAHTLLNSSRTDLPTDEEINGVFVQDLRNKYYNNTFFTNTKS
jgi:adenine-specific DNA-methyltransferase